MNRETRAWHVTIRYAVFIQHHTVHARRRSEAARAAVALAWGENARLRRRTPHALLDVVVDEQGRVLARGVRIDCAPVNSQEP